MILDQYIQLYYPLMHIYDERIRTLGLYQPFGTLMHHGKIETRWVKKGKKPPFPLGLYLIYSTKKMYEAPELYEISGRKGVEWMNEVLRNDNTIDKCGYALSIGELYQVSKMTRDIELECFVQYRESETHDLHALRFKNVKRLEPYQWKYGKQGIGFVPKEEYKNIIIK